MKKIIVLTLLVIMCVAIYILMSPSGQQGQSGLDSRDVAAGDDGRFPDEGPVYFGKVEDGVTGKPLAAEVMIKRENEIVRTVRCGGGDGQYRLGVENGRYEIVASFENYVTTGRKDVHIIDIDDDSPEDLTTIDLWPPAVVRGRVISDGRGLDATIRMTYQGDDSGEENYVFKTVRTDGEGALVTDGAYGGIADVDVEARGYVRQQLTDL